MSDAKLNSDINLMKAVEQLDEELRPFIEAQQEARGLSGFAEEDKADDKASEQLPAAEASVDTNDKLAAAPAGDSAPAEKPE